MSQIRKRQFKVQRNSKLPFTPSMTPKGVLSSKGPHGSLWDLPHLNSLHLHLTSGERWRNLFPKTLNELSVVIFELKRQLGADWYYICNADHQDSVSIYAYFKQLINQRIKDDDHKTDTHTSTDLSSPPSSHTGSLRSSISPQQIRQSAMSRQDRETTPTPHLTSPYTSPTTPRLTGHRQRPSENLQTPPRPVQGTIPHNTPSRNTPTYHQDPEDSPSSSRIAPRSQMTYGTAEYGFEDVQALKETARDNKIRRLVAEEEQEEREAQDRVLQTQNEEEDEPSEAASEGKSENEVRITGSALLAVVENAMRATEKIAGLDDKKLATQNLKMDVHDSTKFEITVDGINMTVQSDQSLFCGFGDVGQRKTVEVMVEFKKRNHKLSATRILGQECAELLGAAVAEKEYLDRIATQNNKPVDKGKMFTSYLISWHGLMAYVSRFDATYEYLETLKQDSRRLQNMPPPYIRRSQLLNLTVTQDRIDLATIAATIAIQQLSEYERNRHSGLIRRLTAGSDQLVKRAAGSGLRDRLCDDCRVVHDSYQQGR